MSTELQKAESSADGAAQGGDKTLYFIRHGESLYNEFKAKFSTWALCKCWCCCDPGLYDPALSAKGKQQVAVLRKTIVDNSINKKVEAILVSPLSRAIDTCLGGFEGDEIPTTVTPLIREVMDTRGDIGRQPEELAQDYTTLDFSSLPQNWWYYNEAKGPLVPVAEPRPNLEARQAEFIKLVLEQFPTQRTIAVVGHSMFIKTLTKSASKLPNCGVLRCSLDAQGKLTKHEIL